MPAADPANEQHGFETAPDGAGYLASYGDGETAIPRVRLWLPRELVDSAVLAAAGLSIDITADGMVQVYSDSRDGTTLASAAIDALIAEALELLDGDEDLPQLASLETKLERGLDAVRMARRQWGST